MPPKKAPLLAALYYVYHMEEVDMDDIPEDVHTHSQEEIWRYVDRMLPDRVQQLRSIMENRPNLRAPAVEHAVTLGRREAHKLPPIRPHALDIAALWALNEPAEVDRRTRIPPVDDLSNALRVVLVLGTHMEIGRIRYDQLTFAELDRLRPEAMLLRDYTAVIDLADTEAAESVQRDLYRSLVTDSRSSAEPEGSPERAELDLAKILIQLLDGTRQVSFTTMQALTCPNQGCKMRLTGPLARRTTPEIPAWCTDSRRYPGSLSALLDLAFGPARSTGTRKIPCRSCKRPTVSICTVLDSLPLRLVLSSGFRADELRHDKFKDISFAYINPSKERVVVIYKWYAVVFRSTAAGQAYILLLNVGDGTFLSYDTSRTPARIHLVAGVQWKYWKDRQVVARVYSLDWISDPQQRAVSHRTAR